MSKLAELNKKYKKLLEQSYKLSTKNRRESDEKYNEAQQVLSEIEAIEKAQ